MERSLWLLLLAGLFINLLAQDTLQYKPGDHELLIMPTAYTMEKGQAYFTNYELLFLNFTYASSNKTHIGIFTLFPITSQFLESLTFGIKQNYFKTNNSAMAFWATFSPKIDGFAMANVFSYRTNPRSFHLGLGVLSGFSDNYDKLHFLYMLGFQHDFSNKIALLAEYTNLSSFSNKDSNGVISIGLRFRGSSQSWEIGGLRPLENIGDIIFLPILKASFFF